jgi:hypothetical protein
MVILRKNECLLAILLLYQAGAFMGGRPAVHSFNSHPSTDTLLPSSRHMMFSPHRRSHQERKKSHLSIANDVAVDPITESPESSVDDDIKKSRPKPLTVPKKKKLQHHNSGGRKDNPAMGDTQFLRKRTAELMRATSLENEDGKIPHRGMKVKTKTFHFLIDAWAFSGEMDAADQALKLLNRMEELEGSNCPSNVRPDVRSYTKVINAVARSMRIDAGDIAEIILEKMENLHTSGANTMGKPNTFTYTAVIEAYTNSGADGAAEKSEELLDTMIRKYENGHEDVRPTARSFNAVINAYGKSGYPGAAQQAEYLFERMGNLYMSGVGECKPNTFNYNSLIIALANSAEEGAAERAADLLKRMEQNYKSGDADCKPTTVTFNAVINAFAKSGQEDGAQRAEETFLRMEKLYEAGEDVQPNTRSFNSVLNAWAKSPREDAAQHAQDLFDFMNGHYKNANKSLQPDVHSFCTVINGTLPSVLEAIYSSDETVVTHLLLVFFFCQKLAWGRSHETGKAEHASNLFETMVKSYKEGNKNLKPNIVVVNAVINACAYTYGDGSEHQRALEIAHNQLKQLETSDYGSADHLTYGTFLKVCANQMPDCDTRRQIMEVIFKKCIRDGQLGNLVLQQLRAMGPPETYSKLVGREIEDDMNMEALPQEWHSNVVEGKWRRRRNHESGV